MRNFEDCVHTLGLVEKRLESQDKLFELLNKVLAPLWWMMGNDGQKAISVFQAAHVEHRKLVASLREDLERTRGG